MVQDGRAGIDAELVRRLVAAQFPQWAELQVRPVPVEGWDNRTYHLGDDMTVRLPTHEAYAAAVEKEDRWLPVLAPKLPVPVPVPLGLGQPTEEYPHHWSVRPWLHGRTANRETVHDLDAFALQVADFLLALQKADTTGGPKAGAHCFYRGTPPVHYDDEARRCLAALEGRIDTSAAAAVWEAAITSTWQGPDVWFHGDVANGNLLVEDGRLAAVIDFGTSGVGDPASDLVIAWTFFDGTSRETFREAMHQDEGTWARARGWALWKSLLGLEHKLEPENLRIVATVIGEHHSAA